MNLQASETITGGPISASNMLHVNLSFRNIEREREREREDPTTREKKSSKRIINNVRETSPGGQTKRIAENLKESQRIGSNYKEPISAANTLHAH